MKIIIIAAGQSREIENLNKILIRNPKTGRTIMDEYLSIFLKDDIEVVVGYDAVNIISQYPNLNYVYNRDWRISGNSYSLGLALSEEPCIVLSSDYFMDMQIIDSLKSHKQNVCVTKDTANRGLDALNCLVKKDKVISINQGPVKNGEPEAIGIFKFSNQQLLRKLKNNCLQYPNLLIGQNIPLNITDIYEMSINQYRFTEINTVLDYINFIKS